MVSGWRLAGAYLVCTAVGADELSQSKGAEAGLQDTNLKGRKRGASMRRTRTVCWPAN